VINKDRQHGEKRPLLKVSLSIYGPFGVYLKVPSEVAMASILGVLGAFLDQVSPPAPGLKEILL
jgi:hypothetical protein